MDKIRWGFMGAGRIASDFATALMTHKDAELQAVASSDKGRSQKFADKFHVKNVYGCYADVATDPDVDVIYINRTHNFHLEDAKLALQNGKAVLCEKPLTLNLKEAQDMVALAREKKTFLMMALWTRFFPAIIRLMELVDGGVLGDIVSVQTQFGFKGDENNERMSKRSLGGGALLDIGVYNLFFSYLVFGRNYPTKIISNAHLHETEKTDLQINGIMEFGGANKTANFVCSILGDHSNSAFVVGTKGTVEIPKPFHCPTTLIVNIHGEEKKVEEFPLPDAAGELNKKGERNDYFFNYPNSDGMYYEADHVMKCLKEKREESELVTREDALKITQLLDEIRLSHGVIYPVDE